MADMGFGLTREGVMAMAFAIANKTGQSHPFKQGYADGMKALKQGKPLLHCAHLRHCSTHVLFLQQGNN